MIKSPKQFTCAKCKELYLIQKFADFQCVGRHCKLCYPCLYDIYLVRPKQYTTYLPCFKCLFSTHMDQIKNCLMNLCSVCGMASDKYYHIENNCKICQFCCKSFQKCSIKNKNQNKVNNADVFSQRLIKFIKTNMLKCGVCQQKTFISKKIQQKGKSKNICYKCQIKSFPKQKQVQAQIQLQFYNKKRGFSQCYSCGQQKLKQNQTQFYKDAFNHLRCWPCLHQFISKGPEKIYKAYNQTLKKQVEMIRFECGCSIIVKQLQQKLMNSCLVCGNSAMVAQQNKLTDDKYYCNKCKVIIQDSKFSKGKIKNLKLIETQIKKYQIKQLFNNKQSQIKKQQQVKEYREESSCFKCKQSNLYIVKNKKRILIFNTHSFDKGKHNYCMPCLYQQFYLNKSNRIINGQKNYIKFPCKSEIQEIELNSFLNSVCIICGLKSLQQNQIVFNNEGIFYCRSCDKRMKQKDRTFKCIDKMETIIRQIQKQNDQLLKDNRSPSQENTCIRQIKTQIYKHQTEMSQERVKGKIQNANEQCLRCESCEQVSTYFVNGQKHSYIFYKDRKGHHHCFPCLYNYFHIQKIIKTAIYEGELISAYLMKCQCLLQQNKLISLLGSSCMICGNKHQLQKDQKCYINQNRFYCIHCKDNISTNSIRHNRLHMILGKIQKNQKNAQEFFQPCNNEIEFKTENESQANQNIMIIQSNKIQDDPKQQKRSTVTPSINQHLVELQRFLQQYQNFIQKQKLNSAQAQTLKKIRINPENIVWNEEDADYSQDLGLKQKPIIFQKLQTHLKYLCRTCELQYSDYLAFDLMCKSCFMKELTKGTNICFERQSQI